MKTDLYPSLVALLEESFRKYRDQRSLPVHGQGLQLRPDRRSVARWRPTCSPPAWQRGDRVAVMMPNVPQYPVAGGGHPARRHGGGQRQPAVHAARAGTPAQGLGRQGHHHPGELCRHAAAGDRRRCPRRPWCWPPWATCWAWSRAPWSTTWCATSRRWCRRSRMPGAVAASTTRWRSAGASLAPRRVGPDDIAVLQYTGGTTGVSKGAVLLHRNLVANVLQAEAWYQPALQEDPAGRADRHRVRAAAVPHLRLQHEHDAGHAHGRLQHADRQPARHPGAAEGAGGAQVPQLSGRQHLFNAMANHPDFDKVDWSHLKISVGGGMAVQQATARLWLDKTGCPICEGYGLSRPARRPPATRWMPPPTAAPSACRCPAPS
jgi:long-chain acyl-CoA synthetase